MELQGIGWGPRHDHLGVYPDDQNRGGYALVLYTGGGPGGGDRQDRLAHFASHAAAERVGDWLDRAIGGTAEANARLAALLEFNESVLQTICDNYPPLAEWVAGLRSASPIDEYGLHT